MHTQSFMQIIFYRIFCKSFIYKTMRFLTTSFVALYLHFIINVLGHELLGFNVNITYPISLVMVSLTTFLLSRFFVYPGASEKKFLYQGMQFIISSIIFRILEWGMFSLLVDIFGLWYIFSIIFVQTLGTIIKFIFFNFFVFGHTSFRKFFSPDQIHES